MACHVARGQTGPINRPEHTCGCQPAVGSRQAPCPEASPPERSRPSTASNPALLRFPEPAAATCQPKLNNGRCPKNDSHDCLYPWGGANVCKGVFANCIGAAMAGKKAIVQRCPKGQLFNIYTRVRGRGNGRQCSPSTACFNIDTPVTSWLDRRVHDACALRGQCQPSSPSLAPSLAQSCSTTCNPPSPAPAGCTALLAGNVCPTDDK